MSWIADDINEALKCFPKLKKSTNPLRVYGEFDIANPSNGIVLESYDIEVTFPNGYPHFQLPIVKENSRKITRNPDSHVYSNGEFCLTTPLNEYLICKDGISLKSFLTDIVRPFIAAQLAISMGYIDKFPQGEFRHGKDGIIDSYKDYFEVSNKEELIQALKIVLTKNQRNKKCYCQSGKKLKNCHLHKIKNISFLPRSLFEKDLEMLQPN